MRWQTQRVQNHESKKFRNLFLIFIISCVASGFHRARRRHPGSLYLCNYRTLIPPPKRGLGFLTTVLNLELSSPHLRFAQPLVNQVTTKISTHIIASLSEVDQAAWDGLLALQTDANPFLSFAFLHTLHESGSASKKSGWQPQYLSLWNDAYERNGLNYYPKLLSAITFTPVAGSRPG